MISAEQFFEARLQYRTDPSDLCETRRQGDAPLLIDVRNQAAWDQGRIPGALHIPRPELAGKIAKMVPDMGAEVILYCWGPGCNGSTKAALELTRLGYTNIKELLGGFEYWAREGLSIETSVGRTRRSVDELTAPVAQ